MAVARYRCTPRDGSCSSDKGYSGEAAQAQCLGTLEGRGQAAAEKEQGAGRSRVAWWSLS